MTFANHDYDNDFFCILQLFFCHRLESVEGHGGGKCLIRSAIFSCNGRHRPFLGDILLNG